MASGNHNLSPTCQGTFHVFCQEKTNCHCYSLSRSSSALPCSSVGGPLKKPGIHKSLNSIIYTTKGNENSMVQHSHSSQWSSSKDCPTDPNLVKCDCNHLSVDHAHEKNQHKIHYRSAESSLATEEQKVTQSFARYNVSENISLFGHSESSVCKADSMDHLDSPATIVQKSYSDYFCGRRISVPHSVRENITISATCSNLSACSSISGSGSDRTCTLSNITQDSGIVHSPSNAHNHLTDAFSDKEQNIPLSHLDSGTIQHNITVYTVPGIYQHGMLGPRNSGMGFHNNDYMYSQSHYSIPGVMSCDNINSETKLSPPAMIIHNSCSVHCSKGHEPLMKVDDTIAAYCHSLPIPSIQYSSGLVHSLGEPVLRQTLPQFCTQLPHPDNISFPKLVSSVSESGLDTKKLIRCGRLAFPPPPVSIGEINWLTSELNTSDLLLKKVETPLDVLEIPDSDTKTKDTWTMTSKNYLSLDQKNSLSCRDAEVQTVIVMESKAVSTTPYIQSSSRSHLFPDVGLGITLQCPQTPVREVRYDEEGMTWEVYGAAVDPEVLGLAIQKHLEIQIEQNTQPSEQSVEIEQSSHEKRRSSRTVMQCLRQCNCCACATTSD